MINDRLLIKNKWYVVVKILRANPALHIQVVRNHKSKWVVAYNGHSYNRDIETQGA